MISTGCSVSRPSNDVELTTPLAKGGSILFIVISPSLSNQSVGLEPVTTDPSADLRRNVADRWLSLKDDPTRYTLLREYRGKSVYRFAAGLPAAPTIIVKTWNPGRGSLFRRAKRALVGELSGCHNEISTLWHLEHAAPGLGAPLGFARFGDKIVQGQPCEVGLISDLGECETVAEYLKRCNASSDLQGLADIRDFIIASLRLLVCDANLIDDDHSVINMLHSRRDGTFHRIDFEIARKAGTVRWKSRALGSMLGRLMATCAFACQPDTSWVVSLAAHLQRELPFMDEPVWLQAQRELDRRLGAQFERKGIDTRLNVLASDGAAATGER